MNPRAHNGPSASATSATLRQIAIASIALASAAAPSLASAHCDTTQGPVVSAARAALEAGDPSLVLHWVRAEDEVAVRAAFEHTRKVRTLGPEARALADRYFFETLVRIHRAGEGAAYTGLTDDAPEPIIVATDRALARGSADELERHLVSAVRAGLRQRFEAARKTGSFRRGDVAAGRRFVAAYVSLTHWVEAVSAATGGAAEHHDGAHPPRDTHGTHPTGKTHGAGALRHMPWTFAGMFALVGLAGVFRMRRRRGTSPS